MLGISPRRRGYSHRHRTLGKNLAIRFPVDIAAAAGLRDGERVEIAASKDEVVIRKLPADQTIDSMFAGQPPNVADALPRGLRLGPDQGRERLKE